MRLIFVHDGPLFFDKDGNYYEFAYHELLERYSYIADDIIFLMRTREIIGDKKFTKVPEKINIVSVPNFKSPKLYFTEKRKAETIVNTVIYDADYVVLRTQSSIAQLALKYVKKYKKPYIIESVGCSWDSYWNHGLLGKIIAPYMFYKTRMAIKHAPYVYYVTNKFLQHRYPTKGKTVSCSNVVLETLSLEILNKRLQKIDKFDSKKRLIIGTAAALDTRYKGHEYVIRGLKKLESDGYNVEYHLAGGNVGSKPNTFLKDLAVKCGVEDKVVFVGSLPANQMGIYYDSLDVYIQPSKQEGLPRAVIEAMSRGCPVIGTNIAGIPELLQPEFLFRKGSTKSFIKALQNILSSDLKKIASDNFHRASQYEREKLIKKRESFYDEFLKHINTI